MGEGCTSASSTSSPDAGAFFSVLEFALDDIVLYVSAVFKRVERSFYADITQVFNISSAHTLRTIIKPCSLDNCGGDDTCRESNCYYCYGDPSGSGGGCCCEGTACDCYPCTGQCGVCVNAPDGPCCNACDALWNGGDCCTASMYSDLCCCGACKCTECHSLCNALERGCLPDEACCNVGICASDCQCEGNGGDCDCGGCDCGGCDCNISC